MCFLNRVFTRKTGREQAERLVGPLYSLLFLHRKSNGPAFEHRIPGRLFFVKKYRLADIAPHMETHSPRKMLAGIIENELVTRLALTRCLRNKGFEIVHADSMEDFMKHKPHIIIVSTATTPVTAFVEQAARYFFEEPPLLIITSWSRLEDSPLIDYPNYCLFQKPFVCSQLVTLVDENVNVMYRSHPAN